MSINKRLMGEPEQPATKDPKATRAVVKVVQKETDAETAPWKGGIDTFGEGLVH